MEKTEKKFTQLIDDAFAKINKFQNGNVFFYGRFHKSRAVVSTWKSGKVVPSEADKGLFLKTANDVIKELQVKKEEMDAENSELLNEFTSLVSA